MRGDNGAMEERIRKLGLPEGTVFHGYVVHLPDSEQFLAGVERVGVETRRSYAHRPDQAEIHQHAADARDRARECPGSAEVWEVFSCAGRYYVAPVPAESDAT